MVMVRTPESELFEMAYFVLRADAQQKNNEKSMIDEANSIVLAVCGDRVCDKKEKRKRQNKKVFLFCVGAFFGALFLGVLVILFRVV